MLGQPIDPMGPLWSASTSSAIKHWRLLMLGFGMNLYIACISGFNVGTSDCIKLGLSALVCKIGNSFPIRANWMSSDLETPVSSFFYSPDLLKFYGMLRFASHVICVFLFSELLFIPVLMAMLPTSCLDKVMYKVESANDWIGFQMCAS